ncbi:hypothetical protein [Megamonas hypermegale]|uniref:hypothetical protein n=1 Tax=Megamonas hypermegale TaxID=158847 RepID=UPI0026E9A26C|nr:hypothetical protein [Megamonas hypermegale]
MAGNGKYKQWLTKEGLLRIQGWARDGLTDEQIAKNMNIGLTTFYEWKKRYPEFRESLKENKDVVDRKVENALLKNALNGNVTAQIFWLKNRKPNEWREKRDDVQQTVMEDDGFTEAIESAAKGVWND